MKTIEPKALIKLDEEIRRVYKTTKSLLIKNKRDEAMQIIRYYIWHFKNRKESIVVTGDIRLAWRALREMESFIARPWLPLKFYTTPWRKKRTKKSKGGSNE